MAQLLNPEILIVEDDVDIAEVLKFHIQQMGYEAEHTTNGEGAMARLNQKAYDLVILDWMLPGLSGVEITQIIRKMDSLKEMAILMLTARSDSQDIVKGLEAGADDYMTKPFEPEVFTARVQNLLRRARRVALTQTQSEPTPEPQRVDEIQVGAVKVSLKTYKAFVDGGEVSLTPSEFKLLTTMMQERGRVLTRGRLIEEVQGEGISVIGRTIDTHVFGLRKKLGPYSKLIETIRGVGYRVREDLLEP